MVSDISNDAGAVILDTLSRTLGKLPKNTRFILQTCVYGLGAGLAAVAFHESIQAFFNLTYGTLIQQSTVTLAVGSFVVIVSTSLLVGYLLHFYCPGASGSGIPQLKLAFWKDFGYVPLRVVWVKFLAGVLSIGGGCSLGREGPSVQLAGGLASNLSGWMGEPKHTRRHAAAAGAAAGLAAAFNTPLAAITFVLEEIVQDLNSRILGSVLLASVIGAFVVHGLIDERPALQITPDLTSPDWRLYLLTPIVAAAAAFIGIIFQKSTLALRQKRKGFAKIPPWLRPTIGALVTWILGISVFWYTRHATGTGNLGVFGVGYQDLSAALMNLFDWRVAGILLAAKLVATFACYGFGGCGGIFSPTLFLGGMCGVFLSGLFGTIMDLGTNGQVILAVVGMSACLGVVVRAPVTGILIVFEMTHEFTLVPALMLGALVSSAIGRRFCKTSFYESLLQQDGHNLEHVIPPRDLQSCQQLPVSAIANFQPIFVEGLNSETITTTLGSYPYQCFPMLNEGVLVGFLTRKEAELALKENRTPKLEPPTTCLPSQTIRELQFLLIESTTHVVALQDRTNGRTIGLVTLHDLLRAEVSIAKEHEAKH